MIEHDTERQPDEVPPSEIPPLGPVLRAAREARGESLADVAAMLKLSVRQLEAIEGERFGDLPGPAFVRGFVRNYGRHLGVDVEPMIAARWTGGAAAGVQLTPLTNAEGILPQSGERPGLRRFILPVLLVVVVALGLAWYFDGFDPHGVAEVSGTAAPEAPQSAEVGGFPPEAEDEAVEVAPPIPLPPEPMVLPEQLIETGPEVEAPPPALQQPVETPAPVASEQSAVDTPAIETPEPAAAGSGRLVFRLDEESWLDVRDARDRRLYSGISAAGSVRVVQGQPPFTVVIGNARAARLEHGGREVDLAPHTSSGGVARLRVE